MHEKLEEYCDWQARGARVDRETGVIRGVKILGFSSRNGREYLPEALAAAIPLYEGAKVHVNHPAGRAARDYRDRIGSVRGVTLRPGEGLFADFHFNPKHALAEQLVWDAEHAPDRVGFSHNVEGRTSRRGETVVVEAITRVESVDLVADPATTRGLFEDAAGGRAWDALTLDELERHRPDLLAEVTRQRSEEVEKLRAEVEELRAAEARQAREAAARRVLAEYRLPDPETATGADRTIVSRPFLDRLIAAENEESRRQLAHDRAALVEALRAVGRSRQGATPTARDQGQVDRGLATGRTPDDVKAFVKSIT